MSVLGLKATGSGVLDFRLSIEGIKDEWVTSADMVKTEADGRERRLGLLSEGISFSYQADFIRGSIDGQGFTARFIDVDEQYRGNRRATALFAQKPTVTSYLLGTSSSGVLNASATTIEVTNATGFSASGGYAYIGTETIKYTGRTTSPSDTLTGCTRGVWDSTAQYHYQNKGEYEFYTPITNQPLFMEGRTAKLYLYGSGDNHQGDGTIIFTGIVAGEPSHDSDGWSLEIASVADVLKRDLGGIPIAPPRLRGIYYPESAPFMFALRRFNGTTWQPRVVSVSGFFETEQAFASAVNSEIQVQLASYGLSPTPQINAIPIDGGLEIFYNVLLLAGEPAIYVSPISWGKVNRGSDLNLSARGVTLNNDAMMRGLETDDRDSADAPGFYKWFNYLGTGSVQAVATSETGTLAQGRYRFRIYAPFPRCYLGPLGTGSATLPANRIYYSGTVPMDVALSIGIESDSDSDKEGEPSQRFFQISAVNTTDRYVTVNSGSLSGQSVNISAKQELSFGPRAYTNVSFADFLQGISDDVPELVNLGVVPAIQANKHFTWRTVKDSDDAIVKRNFVPITQPTGLDKVLGPELVSTGQHWYIDSNARLAWKRFKVKSSGFTPTTTIGPDDLLGGIPQWEKAVYGQFSEIVYKTGYNVAEGSWDGLTYRFRNLQSSALLRKGQTLSVERMTSYNTTPDVTPAQVVQIAQNWLWAFGVGYEVVSLPVSLKQLDVKIGDTIALTSTLIPGSLGELGIEDRLAIVIGTQWEMDTGSGVLTALVTAREIPGIAPSYLVASQVNTSGNNWTITVSIPHDGDETPNLHFVAGDLVQLKRRDSTATESATVNSVTASTILLTTNTTWTPSTFEWIVRPRAAVAIPFNSNLSNNYVFLAESDSVIAFDGGNQEAATWGSA